MDHKSKAQQWLDSPVIDDQTKAEIGSFDDQALQDAFYKDLEFGTGGLRGEMGAGTNRINRYTIGMATQGLANYLKSYVSAPSVAIAYDSRNNSSYFALVTADVLSSNGIKVYLFDELRPTPELSFAVRELGCSAGVVITASHNPREYNGYKVYWNDGGQLVPPHDLGVIDEVRKIGDFSEVKFEPNSNLIQSIGSDIDEKYLAALKNLSLSDDSAKDLKIVFSSIHGTGITMVPPVLEKFGFTNVHIVEEQAEANGDFPTVVYPNPEEQEAMKLALDKARKLDADLILATDPDADRVGIGVKNLNGEFQLLNGNQAAAILLYYILNQKAEHGLKGNEFISKTIVTSDLLTAIADHYKIPTYETLTGFKYIAELIREKEGAEQFLAGGEESYGYLVGDVVRDKDAVISCAMIAEAVAWANSNGKTAFELLLEIYEKFGFYLEKLVYLTKKGKSGAEEIQELMKRFREDPPSEIGGSKIMEVLDYKEGSSRNLNTGVTKEIEMPRSNVLQFITEDEARISVRPSGTEPKIKFYFSVKEPLSSADNYFETLQILEKKLNSLSNDIGN